MIHVSAAIIQNMQGEILICQRGSGGNCACLWEFPGGKQEPDETLEECLIRECKEEMEITISIIGLFAETLYTYPDQEIAFSFFKAEIIDGTIKKDIHNDIRWVSPIELCQYEFCPADMEVVDKIIKGTLFDESYAYYNNHAQSFYDGTVNADMGELRRRFLQELKPEAYVLDLGCGSGRDGRAFLRAGYYVTLMDPSQKMCEMAETLTGQPCFCITAQEMIWENEFDGIWACASLLHVGIKDTHMVYEKIEKALRPGGVLFVSYKYGQGEKIRGDRFFHYMDEEALKKTVEEIRSLRITEMWVTEDVRPDRTNEKWLNAIIVKGR